MNKKKTALQAVMLVAGVAFNIWGLLSLVQTTGTDVGLAYLDSLRLLVRYVIVVITMAAGIMLLTAFAGTLPGKAKNILSITVCTYSTVLTIPLFLTFVLCFVVASGTPIPMVTEICNEFTDIFKPAALHYFIFVLGTIMGIVFLAVPIISTYCTVKNIDLFAVIKEKILKKKPCCKDSAGQSVSSAGDDNAVSGDSDSEEK